MFIFVSPEEVETSFFVLRFQWGFSGILQGTLEPLLNSFDTCLNCWQASNGDFFYKIGFNSIEILFSLKREMDFMDKAGVRAAFVAAGLSRVLKDIDFLAKDSIRLYTKLAGEYDLSIGASRIGGVPDVPPDFKWPERNGVPQSFIAQTIPGRGTSIRYTWSASNEGYAVVLL